MNKSYSLWNPKLKLIVVSLALILAAFLTNAQRIPKIKAGVGMPVIWGNTEGDTEWHTIQTFPAVFVEKPFPVGPKQKQHFSVNPGLAYYFFMEDQMKGTETIGFNYQLYHHTANAYAKFLFHVRLKRRSEAYVYLGPVGGIHIFSKTTGTQKRYLAGTDQHKLELKVNENGRDFFDLLYYGAVVGFQPHAKITNLVRVSVEVAYYPGFIRRETQQSGMIQFSLFAGLYP